MNGIEWADALDALQQDFFAAPRRPSHDMLNADWYRSTFPVQFGDIEERSAQASALARLEAVSQFVLEVLYPAAVSEGLDTLLGSVSDPVDSLSEFPHLGRLRTVFQACRPGGALSDVRERLLELLALTVHSSSSPVVASGNATNPTVGDSAPDSGSISLPGSGALPGGAA